VTWLWTLLIVVGIGMIAVAVWPSVRERFAGPPAAKGDATAADDDLAAAEGERDPEGV
jgi:hypothetical protein